MIKLSENLSENRLLNEVKELILEVVRRHSVFPDKVPEIEALLAGKMLRTKLAIKLLGTEVTEEEFTRVKYGCAAIELVHTGSLFHDDVIDHASLRRGKSTLWKRLTTNASILTGDYLFCEAFSFFGDPTLSTYISAFTSKIQEVLLSEVEQELVHRGNELKEDASIGIARRKTGPLFAFPAELCSGGDPDLRERLREVGYRIGTAYQLFDDLMDEIGNEEDSDKTPGTDRLRKKYTLAHNEEGQQKIVEKINELCETSLEMISQWEQKHNGLNTYLLNEFNKIYKKDL